MIVSDKKNSVERFNMPTEGKFHIETSAMAFRTLSQTIYSNPIKAIVRELSTNAYDAHVTVGTPEKPFNIHLPTNLEPYFSIRDFGTGLSHEDIGTVYTTYFFSNKRDSNDFVGCLGLGSKSPFSYTDNYTVISYLDGVARTYAMFIDESGCPSVSLMSEDATDEVNGLEVKLSVSSNYDNTLFSEAASKVYKYFNIKPVINKTIDSDIKYEDEGDNWKRRTNYYYNHVVMGQICYSLDIFKTTFIDKLDEFGNNVKDEQGHNVKEKIDLNEFYEFLDKFPVTLFLPTGAVSIKASREFLEYNSQTICTLYSYLTEYRSQIMTRFQQKIDNCASLFQARNMANKEFFHLRKFSNLVYNGETLKIDTDISLDAATHGTVRKFYLKRNRRYGNSPTVKRGSGNEVSMQPENQVVLVYNDDNRRPIAKCEQNIRNTKLEDRINLYLVDGTLEQLEAFKQEVGVIDNDIVMLSSLAYDAPVRTYAGGSTYRPVSEIYTLNNGVHVANRDYWNRETIDLDSPGVYEVISNYHVDALDPSYTQKLIGAINSIIGDTDVSFIVPSRVKTFENKGWIHLREYVSQALDSIYWDEIEQQIIKRNTVKHLQEMDTVDIFERLRGHGIELIDEIGEYCEENHNNTFDGLNRLSSYMFYGDYSTLDNVKRIREVYSIKKLDEEILERINSFVEEHPMLFMLDESKINGNNISNILDYLGETTNVASVY